MKLQEYVDGLDSDVDYLENQGRRSNIHTDGMAETPSETWEQTEQLSKEIFAHSLGLSNLSTEHAHHMGPKTLCKVRSIEQL